MLYEIQKMTRDEVAELISKTPVLILPTGATEQHGHHLPLGTDSYIATEICNRVGNKLDMGVLPCLDFGYSWVWNDIAGTGTMEEDVFQKIIFELAENFGRQGVKILCVINGHDANSSLLKYACRKISQKLEIKLLYYTYPNLEQIKNEVLTRPLWHGMPHAGEMETSLVLDIKPELVKLEKAVAEYPEKPELYGKSDIQLGHISSSGVFGDPTCATAEKGEQILALLEDCICENISLAMEKYL